ncbi:mycofactocin precursor MftA [Mycobacterium lepromatosis]|nr:mycofactocin precursor MftA [Mycobacterium lepromatosis]
MDHETDSDTELVTEILVEEMSTDGMCGICRACSHPCRFVGLAALIP